MFIRPFIGVMNPFIRPFIGASHKPIYKAILYRGYKTSMEAEIMFQPSLPSHPQKLQHLSQQGLPTPSALSSPLRSVESLFLGPVKKPHVSIQKHQVDHVGNCWVVQDKWWVEYVTFIYIYIYRCSKKCTPKAQQTMCQYVSVYIYIYSGALSRNIPSKNSGFLQMR